MRSTTRTYLVVCTWCVVAVGALAAREPLVEEAPEEEEAEELELEESAEEEVGRGDVGAGALGKLRVLVGRRLEPEAEMLPAYYEGVRPPGVDHMEMAEKARGERPRHWRRRELEH